MTRTPAYLAALASSAVPGLDPVAVRAARGLPGNRCDVAFVTDTQRRAWVVRVPTTPAVGAQLDAAVPLLALIARRLPFQVPSPRGFVGVPDGRAVVYPFLHGRSVVLEEVSPGPGVAAELGRALAALHNVDRAVFEEAGVAVYDAETYRSRHLSDLDRAAATGHVPAALLSRWEKALENVSAWRFAPTPVHGDVRGGRVLVSFAQEDDPGTATVRALTGWEHAKVADPADDLAAFAAECSPETFESVIEAYAVARIERPDRHLRLRAWLAAELRGLTGLLDAVAAGEPLLITRRAAELRALDDRTADLPDLVPPTPAEPDLPRPTVTTAPVPPSTPAQRAPEAGPEGTGESESEPEGEAGPMVGPEPERDESQDTQRLLLGDLAEPTTVIPEHELARLRAAHADRAGAADEDRGEAPDETSDPAPADEVLVVAVETTVARDDSWYQVIEPVLPPDDGTDDPGNPEQTADGAPAQAPTIVLVEEPAETPAAPDTTEAPDTTAAPDTTTPPETTEPTDPTGPEPRTRQPGRRPRRAQRPPGG